MAQRITANLPMGVTIRASNQDNISPRYGREAPATGLARAHGRDRLDRLDLGTDILVRVLDDPPHQLEALRVA